MEPAKNGKHTSIYCWWPKDEAHGRTADTYKKVFSEKGIPLNRNKYQLYYTPTVNASKMDKIIDNLAIMGTNNKSVGIIRKEYLFYKNNYDAIKEALPTFQQCLDYMSVRGENAMVKLPQMIANAGA